MSSLSILFADILFPLFFSSSIFLKLNPLFWKYLELFLSLFCNPAAFCGYRIT